MGAAANDHRSAPACKFACGIGAAEERQNPDLRALISQAPTVMKDSSGAGLTD